VAADQRVRPVAQPPQHLESDVGGQDGEEPESFAPSTKPRPAALSEIVTDVSP